MPAEYSSLDRPVIVHPCKWPGTRKDMNFGSPDLVQIQNHKKKYIYMKRKAKLQNQINSCSRSLV
jgi:hypothetical protein